VKIALIGAKEWPARSGGDKVVEAIASRIGAHPAHEVTVYCARRYSMDSAQAAEGVRLVRLPILPGKYTRAASLFLLASLHALARGGYDVVHVHHVEACFVLPLLRARFKVIATSHGPAHRRGKWNAAARLAIRSMEYPFAFLADAATSVSANQAAYYTARYGRTVYAIPNGVNAADDALAEPVPGEARPGSPYIAFAAQRIIPTKGCGLLLLAFRDLADPALRLLVIGDLSEYPHRAERLKRLATERVSFQGSIDSSSSLRSLLEGAAFFVFPSSVEGMSMMLLEVASWGIPIVSSDIPENLEILHGCALFFRSGDADHLRERMRWALDNPDAMAALARNARTRVRRDHGWDRITDKYAELYRSVVRGREARESDHTRRAPRPVVGVRRRAEAASRRVRARRARADRGLTRRRGS
jgi:glycosyltransferase involved in cell wall biosynthesis